jgi:hypothetical protein
MSFVYELTWIREDDKEAQLEELDRRAKEATDMAKEGKLKSFSNVKELFENLGIEDDEDEPEDIDEDDFKEMMGD